MKEQPHYDNLLTKEFFDEHYVNGRKSLTKIKSMLNSQGKNLSLSTIHKYAKRHGIQRTIAEGMRNRNDVPLDWSKSFLTKYMFEAIDGFLLGDGGINANKTTMTSRLACGVEIEEFCYYQMSFFEKYGANCTKYDHAGMNQGFVWQGQTLTHPDLQWQYARWYKPHLTNPNKFEKQPPNDIRITPLSVMLWYLGDGCLMVDEKSNTITLRISTDSFLPERVEYLAYKLKVVGIDAYRNGDNRIQVSTKGIPAFFDFIGRKSPVKCYDYKFDLPEWRLESLRMKDVAQLLDIDYHKLAYKVKIGKIDCFRAADGGLPRFLPKHIEAIRIALTNGEFYKDERK